MNTADALNMMTPKGAVSLPAPAGGDAMSEIQAARDQLADAVKTLDDQDMADTLQEVIDTLDMDILKTDVEKGTA